MTSRRIWLLSMSAILISGSARADEGKVVFNRDIRPILSDACFRCHGPDTKARKGSLRLDTREGALKNAASGDPAIVPGKSADSELVKRITATDPQMRMPPAESGKSLTPAQIALLKKWVDQGAEYQGHWAYIKPERPALPEVKTAGFVRTPVDRFILARLEREGLKPSPEAEKVTLIRRATLDLHGLPPTPAEVDAFLADNSADAYEKLIDRLLAHPRYGEHMARHWLDLARYGDTHGLHLDNERSLWMYREWVIGAFNRNLPFDQFTIEQLAGDLLPNPTLQQKVATGFNRCNVTTSEGGSIDAEVLVRYAVDRTETLGTVFMGQTLACSVCHDHKFDPFTQKDFYRLFAYYNASADAAMDGNKAAPPPILRAPTGDQELREKELDAKLAEVRRRIAEALKKAEAEYRDPAAPAPATVRGAGAATGALGAACTENIRILAKAPAAAPAPKKPDAKEPREFVWIDEAAPKGANVQGKWDFVAAPSPVFSGKKSMRQQGDGLIQFFFDGVADGPKIGAGDKLFAYVWLDPKSPPAEIMLQFNDGAWEHRAYWGEDKIDWGAAGTASRAKMGPLPEAGKWVRLEVDAAKVGLAPDSVLKGWAFTQFGGTAYFDKAGLVTRTGGPSAPAGPSAPPVNLESLASWTAHEKALLAKSKLPQPVKDALKADKRNDAQKKVLRDHFLQNVFPGTRAVFEPLNKELEAADKAKKDLDAAIPVTLIMSDLPKPRDTFILIRGAYDKHGEKVTAGTPTILPPPPPGAPANRLGLAKWLVDPSHPLTARVTVNRFWQQVFGRGLVKTSEDFGSQGEWPSHPDLLDWLAVEFRETGWDVKRLMKLMLTSATYRQSSVVTSELLKRDPENVLLARGPRFRLDAEVVRDGVLYVSGLLVEKVGGRSVKTYQPQGIWESVAFVGSNTREFKRDNGEALYRRSMYTFWKRTAPHPSMAAFDAPSRENCTVRRQRTNTPLQALALMNDEQYVEAARKFAERILAEGGSSPAERLSYGFRWATGRSAEPAELGVLSKVLEHNLAHFRINKDAAVKLLSVGESKRNDKLDPAEHAAWAMLANLLLNLDEAITKE